MRVRATHVFAAVLATGCSPGRVPSVACSPPETVGALAAAVRESSGIAASRRRPGVLWTHNDSGGDATLYAIDATGALLGRVRVDGARNVDWEDIALGPCPAGDCLYIADTGDNRLRRDDAAIYRVPEPAPEDSVTAPAERFSLRYPDGPRDVEALYIGRGGDLFLVTKGHDHPIELYRYPAPPPGEEPVVLERVQALSDRPVPLFYQVTGAAATRDGRWAVIRTYATVQLYRIGPGGRLRPYLPAPGIDLDTLAEPQGEAVEILETGEILLASEAGPGGAPGPISRIACRLP